MLYFFLHSSSSQRQKVNKIGDVSCAPIQYHLFSSALVAFEFIVIVYNAPSNMLAMLLLL